MAWSPRINNGRQMGRNGLTIREPRPDLNHKVQNHAIQENLHAAGSATLCRCRKCRILNRNEKRHEPGGVSVD